MKPSRVVTLDESNAPNIISEVIIYNAMHEVIIFIQDFWIARILPKEVE